jgi:hypothetical protein
LLHCVRNDELSFRPDENKYVSCISGKRSDDKKFIAVIDGNLPDDGIAEKSRCFRQRRQENLNAPTNRPVIANPQGEAIQRTRMDYFTLRVRNDGKQPFWTASRTARMSTDKIGVYT